MHEAPRPSTPASLPPRWTLEQLQRAELEAPVLVWATALVAARARAALPFGVVTPARDSSWSADVRTLIVIGGGKLIDRAKWLRFEARRGMRLVACASMWGSGAEVSSIAVRDDGLEKRIVMGDGVAPDVRLAWPELALSVSAESARRAAGDVWAHVLEAMLSPLASPPLVARCGALVRTLLDASMQQDPRWFEWSAEATLLQAASSVGLVHGIAHVLEGPMALANPALGSAGGHAALCATFLWPVLRLVESRSSAFAERCEQAGVSKAAALQCARALHDQALYDSALGLLEAAWKRVLRDPCTRTTATLIRPADLAYFTERAFL